jgi:hypothetical protein|tara:strand:+ start:813 stop:953 length:141 start_codon:yes stop_codon:yes gene_type:complete
MLWRNSVLLAVAFIPIGLKGLAFLPQKIDFLFFGRLHQLWSPDRFI